MLSSGLLTSVLTSVPLLQLCRGSTQHRPQVYCKELWGGWNTAIEVELIIQTIRNKKAFLLIFLRNNHECVLAKKLKRTFSYKTQFLKFICQIIFFSEMCHLRIYVFDYSVLQRAWKHLSDVLSPTSAENKAERKHKRDIAYSRILFWPESFMADKHFATLHCKLAFN